MDLHSPAQTDSRVTDFSCQACGCSYVEDPDGWKMGCQAYQRAAAACGQALALGMETEYAVSRARMLQRSAEQQAEHFLAEKLQLESYTTELALQVSAARASFFNAIAAQAEQGRALEAAQAELGKLRAAVTSLYYSAHWTPDREVDEEKIWTDLRDAAGFEVGKSPARVLR